MNVTSFVFGDIVFRFRRSRASGVASRVQVHDGLDLRGRIEGSARSQDPCESQACALGETFGVADRPGELF
jgi:hypothetical protein